MNQVEVPKRPVDYVECPSCGQLTAAVVGDGPLGVPMVHCPICMTPSSSLSS